jgi:hypothetical protein
MIVALVNHFYVGFAPFATEAAGGAHVVEGRPASGATLLNRLCRRR